MESGEEIENGQGGDAVTLRCGFCATLVRVDMARAAERPTCGSCSRPMLLDRPIKVTQEDFDRTVLGSGAPVLVDFYADWCAPCKMVAPFIDQIAGENVGTLLVVKLDTDRAPEIAGRYGIRSIPTLILYRDGEEVDRSIGFEPERLREMVTRAVT